MGQKCCSPAMRLDPKHITLLTLIYQQTQQNTTQLHYQSIITYLTKKGYIKTLTDYLSSHLNQINATLLICRNKQFTARKQSQQLQIVDCIITTEILRRIISLTKQMKEKYQSRIHTTTLGNEKDFRQIGQPNQLKYSSLQQFSNFKQSGKGKSKHISENELHKSIKTKAVRSNQNIQFIEDQIAHTVLQTCNEVIKQTLNCRNNFTLNPMSNQSTVSDTLFIILMNVQNILREILDKEGGFLKVDYNMLKQILDNQIVILMMCRKQNQQAVSQIIKKNRNSQSIVLFQNATNMFHRHNSHDIKNNQIQEKRKSNLNVPISVFQQNIEEKNKMSKLCLGNYYQLIHKANIHMANTNLYKDIVKMHMPKLLQFWRDLMIFQEHNPQIKNKSELENIEETSDEEQKQAYPQQTVKYEIKNAQYIQLIILEFFNSYFSFRQSQYIYRELMIMFDKLYFHKSRIESIEKLFFQALKNYELRDSVISKWFDYMLDYLGIIISSSNQSKGLNDSEQKDIITPNDTNIPVSQERNYLSEIELGLNFQNLKFQYINWTKEQNIIGCIKTIKRWIETKVLDLQTILNYKRTKLLISLLANLARGKAKIKATIIKFISYLVANDVRCFGYLIEAALSLLNSLKINNDSFEQSGWENYFNKPQKNYNNTFKQTLDNNINKTSSLQTKKSHSFYKLKSFKNNELNIQIISVQKFIDEIISVAGFPYLNKLVHTFHIENYKQLQLPKHIRRLSSPSIIDLPKQLSLERKKDSSIKLQSGFENLETKNTFSNQFRKHRKSQSFRLEQYNDDKSNINSLYIRSVFQQTISILFKSLKINSSHSQVSQKYRIRLASVVLTNSLESIVVLSSLNKKQLTYTFQLASKINRFLSKIYKQLKYVSLDHENTITEMITSRQRSYDQDNEVQNFVHLRIAKLDNSNTLQSAQINGDQNQSVSKIKYHNRPFINNQKVGKKILESLHLWLYPALCNYLSTDNRFQLKKAQNSVNNSVNNQNEEANEQNKKKIKIEISIILKLYFKNILSLSKQSIQSIKKSLYYQNSLLQKSMEQQQFHNQIQKNLLRQSRLRKVSVSNALKLEKQNKRNQQIQQDSQLQRQYFKNGLLPINQVFQLYLTSYNNYLHACQTQQKQNKMIQIHQLNQQKITQLDKKEKNKKNKQRIQQQLNSKYKVQKQKQLQKQTENSLINEIKVLKKKIIKFQDYKNQFLYSKNNEINYQYEEKSQKYLNSFQNIEKVQQIQVWDSNDMNSHKHLQQKILHQIEEVIFNEQLTSTFFKFIDKITVYHQDLPKLMKSKSTDIFTKTTDQIVDNYLTKNQHSQKQLQIATQTQQVNRNNQCFNFQKTKNKIMKVFGRTNSPEQQNPPNLNKAPEQTFSSQRLDRIATLDYAQINSQNAYVALPKIIDIFSQEYELNSYALPSNLTIRSNQIKTKGAFSLGENDFNKKQSIMNSSKFSSSFDGSYGDILDEIQKH